MSHDPVDPNSTFRIRAWLPSSQNFCAVNQDGIAGFIMPSRVKKGVFAFSESFPKCYEAAVYKYGYRPLNPEIQATLDEIPGILKKLEDLEDQANAIQ